MRENADQNNSDYGHFSRSDKLSLPFKKGKMTEICGYGVFVMMRGYVINHKELDADDIWYCTFNSSKQHGG